MFHSAAKKTSDSDTVKDEGNDYPSNSAKVGSSNSETVNMGGSETLPDSAGVGKKKGKSLSDSIRRLHERFPSNTEDPITKKEVEGDVDPAIKDEVRKEEPDQEDKDVQRIKAYGCIFFNVGDPYTHVLKYRRWKACMRNNAVLNHAPEIMMSIVERLREPNEGKLFR